MPLASIAGAMHYPSMTNAKTAAKTDVTNMIAAIAPEKTSAISAAILAHIAAGMAPNAALDAVLGEGTFSRLAGELYDELRARAGVVA